MKMILPLTLIVTLFSTAGALMCETCTNTQCSSTAPVTCTSETMCVTASIQATSSGTTVSQIFKACASSSLCPAAGNQTFSLDLRAYSAFTSAQCCNTDNCNSATLPFPAAQANNGLQCFSCDPTTSISNCTTPLQCRGVEDSCLQTTFTIGSITVPAFGCASSNLCAALSNLNSSLFNLGNISTTVNCCQTSFCNASATTTTAAPTTLNATTTSDASCMRLNIILLLLGLTFFSLY